MKTFELIEIETFDELTQKTTILKTLKITEGKKTIWAQVHPENRHYQEYLRYTAWVEAGNNPEDFWSQSDELSEPKEEGES